MPPRHAASGTAGRCLDASHAGCDVDVEPNRAAVGERVERRETWYEDSSQLQRDLDRFLEYYDAKRSHQGYWLQGRTPVQAFADALSVDPQVVLSPLHPPLEKEACEEENNVAA
jgi:hypothetical protein